MLAKKFRLERWLTAILALFLLPAAGTAQPAPLDEPLHSPYLIIITPTPPADVFTDAARLDARAFEEAGAKSLGDALRLAPEISIVQYGPWGSVERIGLRGASSDRALVLLDGSPVAAGEIASLLQIPLTEVAFIEILRGPSLYGSTGGTINVVTTRAASVQGSRVRSESRFPQRDLAVTEGGFQSNLRFLLSAGRRENPSPLPGATDREHYARLHFERDLSAASEGSVSLALAVREEGAPALSQAPAPGVQRFDDLAALDAKYLHELSGGVIEASAYARLARAGGAGAAPVRHEESSVGAAVAATLDLGAASVKAGVMGQKERAQSDRLVPGDHTAGQSALFGEVTYTSGDTVRLSAGARAAQFTPFGGAVSPYVHLEAAVSPRLRLRASAAHSFTPPTFDDLFRIGVGNPHLRPSRGWRYEAGVSHTVRWGTLDVAAYREQITDRIHWWPDPAGVRRPRNVAQSQRDGLDVTLSAPISSRVTTSVGLSLAYDRETSTGRRLPYVPTATAHWGITYTGAATRGHLELEYVGAQPDGAGGQLSPFTMVNGRIVHAAGRGIDLFAEGFNLFGAGPAGAGADSELPGPSVMVGASVNF